MLFFFLLPLHADSLEDAARNLARRIAAQLGADETVQVTGRNLSSLGRNEAARAQSVFEQALRRRRRGVTQVEISFTISENLKGYLLIADFRRAEQRIVEMEPYRPEPAQPAVHPALSLAKKLLWQQAAPVLDVMVMNDQMLVLDTSGLTRYERQDGKWSAAESAATGPATVRDPRGRVTVLTDALTVDLPGTTCQGTIKPLALRCDSGSVFTAGRNTFEGPPAFFSEARVANPRVVADVDGHSRIHDAVIENWGSDLAAIQTCAGPRIAATSNSDREATDSVTLYDLIQAVPIRVSDPVEFPGPVTALWPRDDGAIAVVRNPATHQYEAYGLTADCSR